jgi:hypothetical protein
MEFYLHSNIYFLAFLFFKAQAEAANLRLHSVNFLTHKILYNLYHTVHWNVAC